MRWLYYLAQTQTPDLDLNEFAGQIGQGVQHLGGIERDTQLAAIVSLFIGVILVIFIYEIRSWNSHKKWQTMYQTETRQLHDDNDKLTSKVEAERQLRHGLEDEISIVKRQLGDCAHDLERLKLASGSLDDTVTGDD